LSSESTERPDLASDSEAPDFGLLFRSLPGCYLVLDRDLKIVAASEAYVDATKVDYPAIVGRHVFDVFPDNPDDLGTKTVKASRASFESVIADGRADTMPVQKHDIRRPEAEGGGYEERYWSPTNSPVLDAKGRVVYVLHQVEDVTDQVYLERRAQELMAATQEHALRSSRYFQQLLDAAPDGMIVVGDDGRLLLVNAQTERIFGYAKQELIGQPLEVLIPARFRGRHAGHLQRFLASPSTRPMGVGLELFGLHKDGRELAIEISLSQLQSERGMTVTATIRDISERKRLEATTRLLADRLASAIESAQDAFALFGDDGRLDMCNRRYRELMVSFGVEEPLGLTRNEIRSASIGLFVNPEAEGERARFDEQREADWQQQRSSRDMQLVDGRCIRITTSRMLGGGWVQTIWELTEDVRLAEELRAARAAAESASAAKSEFLASMSHELRTPLNAILGFAQLLQRDRKEPLSPRHQARAGEILKGGDHLLRLIDDILDLSRIEAGGVAMSIEPVDVSDVLAEVRRTLTPMAAAQGLRLSLDPAPRELPMVAADRTRLVQILMNFGSNAVKYNRPGGLVTFALSAVDEGHVRALVRDTGIGIPADKQGRLFQPFQRAGQEGGPIQGTGIGLVITKRLAELMGGQVGFRSTWEQGSEFWVDLPVHCSDSQAPPPPVARRDATALKLDGHAQILYIEDNPANVAFMRDLLETLESLELVTASTAESGIAQARALCPALIIMDINLPGMSGLEALQVLRDAAETKHIPVIALTAAASERDKQRGLQAGFARYLTKPVNVDEFASALESVLRDAGASSSAE